MQERELQQFQQLKQAVGKSYQQAHPYCDIPIHQWRGQDIVNFQEHLQSTVQGRISEKWFYTHIKSRENNRLPRIDMLNLLSAYAGFNDWQDFKFQHAPRVEEGADQSKGFLERRWQKWGILLGLLGLLGSGIWLFALPKGNYTFCFVDGTTGKPIQPKGLEVIVVEEGESPRKLSCDAKACLELPVSLESIQFIVSAPYYHADTIFRKLNKSRQREEIKLKTDDYALMIHYFSSDNKKDWEKRRKQLEKIFANHAKIFQVSPNHEMGMEMYNKMEFINKLTIPIKSLGQIEVLETIYEEDKIVGLKFIQKEKK
ncbi:MAG: hypothetical protein AAF587_16460 [Bacteroidota bacterium]